MFARSKTMMDCVELVEWADKNSDILVPSIKLNVEFLWKRGDEGTWKNNSLPLAG